MSRGPCLSVGHNRKPYKNGRTDAIWGVDSNETKQPRMVVAAQISTGEFRSNLWGGHTWACQDLPTVDILNLIREGAAAMRPLATSLL